MKQLETMYLMNVSLYITSSETLKDFEFVSKNCQRALQMLYINPFGLNFVYLQQYEKMFPHIETIYELRSLQEIDLFVMYWIDKITFIRKINASLLFYYLANRQFENKEEITKKLLKKIEHISLITAQVDSLSYFIDSIPHLVNVKSIKLKYNECIQWELFNDLPYLKRIEILFLFRCPLNFIEKLKEVNCIKIDYQFIFQINSGDDEMLERIKELQFQLKQHSKQIGININVLTKSMENNYCHMLSPYIDPSYFIENQQMKILHSCYPVELKILSAKKIESVDNIDLKELTSLKKLIINFKNTKLFTLEFPSTINYLSIDSSQAAFNVNQLPLETFFFIGGMHDSLKFNSSLTSISLYNCSNCSLNLSQCSHLIHITISSSRHISVTFNEQLLTFSSYQCFGMDIFLKTIDKHTNIFSFEKVVDFWYKPTSKIICNVECDSFDLSHIQLKHLSLYESSIGSIVLPQTIDVVRINNTAIKTFHFSFVDKLIIQNNAFIDSIEGNSITSLNFNGTVNQWNINSLVSISYHKGYLTPEIECITMKIKSKEEIVNLSQLHIDELILCSKAKTKVLYLNNSIQSISPNKSSMTLFKTGKKQLTKQQIHHLIQEIHCVFPIYSERSVVKINNKYLQSLDLSCCFIKKLIFVNCPQLTSIVIPHSLKHIHFQYCPKLHSISFAKI